MELPNDDELAEHFNKEPDFVKEFTILETLQNFIILETGIKAPEELSVKEDL